MKSESYILVLCILFTFQIKTGLSKDQRYNPSSDFLSHENGGVAYDSKRDYVNQFPALKPSSPAGQSPSTPVNSFPTPKPTNGKRDYVAPQRPTSSPNAATLKPIQSTPSPRPNTPPNAPSKRDYVAPQFPTLKPVGTTPLPPSPNRGPQPGSGNVKDLINFYDNKGQNAPTKTPSFSSILQGNNNQRPSSPTQSTPKSPTSPSKPLSFSNVVSGSNNRPANLAPGNPSKPVSGGSAPTNSPNKSVLPSSIVSNNNNQGLKNAPTDTELQTLSEELLKKDTNNAAKYVTMNYQEKTTSRSAEDKAPLPLLTVAPEAWNIPTVQALLPLLDNYERDTTVNEYVTAQERTEENVFMDAIMSTTVMRYLMTFLKEKGYVTPDPKQQRDFIKQMWFGMYSRGGGKITSSGFEHLFLSEIKNGEPIGLHNWIYFAKEEAANRVNYIGYLKHLSLGDKGSVLTMPYIERGIHKPVGGFFIGLSPELEIALYTLCYVTREGNDCNVKLGSKDVIIKTFNFRYRSKNYIGSAFPRIPQ